MFMWTFFPMLLGDLRQVVSVVATCKQPLGVTDANDLNVPCVE